VLTTSVERLEGNNVKLTVTVPAAQVDDAIKGAYKRLGAKYRFPGFRPGHAPKAILDQQLGREYILADATEEIINVTYSQAVDLESLRPIESPEMEEVDNVEAGADYTYTAQVMVRPELTISSADPVAVVVPSSTASDELVDAQIESMRDRFATLEPVEDRGVEAEDFVLVSFVGTVDGEGYEGNEVDKYLYEMSRGLMPAEFDAGLIGMKPGEESHIEFQIPDTTSNPEFAGKTAGFDVTVHEVKAKALPEVDDEFASNVGGFDTAEEMRADLKSRLDTQAALQSSQAKERAVRDALAERLEGKVPEAMIHQRANTMMRDFQSMLEQRELTIEGYVAATGVTPEQIQADITTQAGQSVREELALEALFRARGMELTDADMDEEYALMGEAGDGDVDEIRARWAELGLTAVVEEQVTHRKAVNYLLETADVTEVDQAEFEAAEAAKSAAAAVAAAEAADTDEAAGTPEAAENTESSEE